MNILDKVKGTHETADLSILRKITQGKAMSLAEVQEAYKYKDVSGEPSRASLLVRVKEQIHE